MADVRSLWDKTLSVLKDELTEVGFKTWFATIEPLALEGNELILSAPNEIHKNTILNKYKTLLVNALNVVSDMPLTFSVVLSGEYEAKEVPSVRPFPEGSLNPRYTFDEFVVGKNNEYAHAACLAVAENPARAYNPLFLYGGAGLGKTHLIQSVGHYILEQDPHAKVLYVTSEKFTNDLINSIKEDKNEEFRNLYRSLDVLLIDDIQFIAGKDSTMEEFFHTFNTLYENKKQIVISSDKPPKDIVGVEDRLISRFKVGLTVDVQPPDYETRVAILVKRAELEHINIEVDALHYVADHISSNIRELEGALRQIYNFSRLKHADRIDTDLAREALKDIIAPDEARPITPEVIIETVTEHYNYKVTKDDILGKNRSRDISYPRQICMYLCEKYTGLSLAAIGAALGNKDHTTVLHGIKKIKTDLEKDEQLRSTIDIITKKLNPPK